MFFLSFSFSWEDQALKTMFDHTYKHFEVRYTSYMYFQISSQCLKIWSDSLLFDIARLT